MNEPKYIVKTTHIVLRRVDGGRAPAAPNIVRRTCFGFVLCGGPQQELPKTTLSGSAQSQNWLAVFKFPYQHNTASLVRIRAPAVALSICSPELPPANAFRA